MPFSIIRNDITKVAADAIVNTANPDPVYADGTDRAIYKASGEKQLLEERRKIGAIHPGEAAVTDAFRLKAKYIIHTVGPVWQDGNHGEFETLSSCYRKSLILASKLGCRSVAFPLISSGVYGFPKDKALDIALKEFRNFLEGEDEEEMKITLVIYDRKALELSQNLVESVEQYIDEKYVEEHRPATGRRTSLREKRERRKYDSPFIGSVLSSAGKDMGVVFDEESDEALFNYEVAYRKDSAAIPEEKPKGTSGRSLQDVVKNIGESFQQMLLRMIDEKGLTDPQVYKGANLDRKLFSKIRCNESYKPSKKTVLALAVALRLSMDETIDLMSRAGFAFSPSSKADVIVRFCIENQIYDIYDINTLLFKYGEQTLG